MLTEHELQWAKSMLIDEGVSPLVVGSSRSGLAKLIVQVSIEIVIAMFFRPIIVGSGLLESFESQEISECDNSTSATLTKLKWPTQGIIKRFAASGTLSSNGQVVKLAGGILGCREASVPTRIPADLDWRPSEQRGISCGLVFAKSSAIGR